MRMVILRGKSAAFLPDRSGGKEILIGKAGEASAKLVPYGRSEEPHRPGALSGDWHRRRFVARRYSWRSRDDG